jgi:hypothetical protein
VEEERMHRQSNAAWFVSPGEEQHDGEDVRPQLPRPLSEEERRLQKMRRNYQRMGVEPGF